MGRRGRVAQLRAVQERLTDGLPERKKPTRPSQCGKYVGQRITDALPRMMDEFLNAGKAANCQQLRVAVLLLQMSPKTQPVRTGSRTISKWMKAMGHTK